MFFSFSAPQPAAAALSFYPLYYLFVCVCMSECHRKVARKCQRWLCVLTCHGRREEHLLKRASFKRPQVQAPLVHSSCQVKLTHKHTQGGRDPTDMEACSNIYKYETISTRNAGI